MTVQTGIEVIGKTKGDAVFAEMIAEAKASRAALEALNGTLQTQAQMQREAAEEARAMRTAQGALREVTQAARAETKAASEREAEAAKQAKRFLKEATDAESTRLDLIKRRNDFDKKAFEASKSLLERHTQLEREAVRDAKVAADMRNRWLTDYVSRNKQQLGVVGKLFMALARTGAQALASLSAASYNARAASDPVRKSIDETAKSVLALKVAAGDTLLPVLAGFGEAFRPLVDGAKAWLKAHRDLVAERIADWAVEISRALTSGVATAAVMSARAWYGLVNAVKAVKQQFMQMSADGGGAIINLQKRLSEFGGRGSAEIRILAGVMKVFAPAAQAVADQTGESIRKNQAELEQLEAGIDKVVVAIGSGLGAVAPSVMKGLEADTHAASEAVRTLKGDMDGAYQAWLAFNKEQAQSSIAKGIQEQAVALRGVAEQQYRWGINTGKAAEMLDQYRDGVRDLRAEFGGLADKVLASSTSLAEAKLKLEDMRDTFEMLKGAGETFLDGFGSAFSTALKDAVKGTKEAGQILENFWEGLGDAILSALVDKLIVSGVVGLLSNVFGGFLGDAAFAIGDLLGLKKGGLVGLDRGGLVRASQGVMVRGSGANGRDSVPALLAPGELVTPYEDVQRNVAAGRAPGDSGLPRRGEGRTINVTYAPRTATPQSDDEVRAQFLRVIMPILREIEGS